MRMPSLLAQDKYSLKEPNGISFSEIRGYEDWQIVAPSYRTDHDEIRIILANDVMINAYRAGIPENGKPGILLPFAFVLAFAIRNPGDLRELMPGLLALTLLFGTSSMEAGLEDFPHTYMVEALRAALGIGTAEHAILELSVLAGFAVILFALAARILARRGE